MVGHRQFLSHVHTGSIGRIGPWSRKQRMGISDAWWTPTGGHLSKLWKEVPLSSRMQKNRGTCENIGGSSGQEGAVSIVINGRNGVDVYLAFVMGGRRV